MATSVRLRTVWCEIGQILGGKITAGTKDASKPYFSKAADMAVKLL
jgi:hypothetical protein